MEKPMEIRKNSLLEKLENYGKSDFYPFHMPGHKRQDFLNGFPDPYSIDITEIDGFDNLHHAEGILKESMERAAEIYGADQTCYLVNGSTCGILSAVCGSTAWGGKLLMARNCHKSAYHGLILNHLEPVYVYPSYLEGPGISGGVCPSDVRRILEQDKKREIQAVLVVSPTYEGVVSDIAGIAAAAHEHGIPLIVDEAHGAHLPFGERENGFPEPALSMGADVVIQSLHKTLPCFTQTAVLHMKGDLADRERICRYLGMFQSSSPSYVFMAAMEQCIRFMDGDGRREMAAYGKRLERFFQQVKDLRNLKVLDWEKIVEADHSRKAGAAPGTISVYGWDPSKIVISCKRVWFKNVSGERQRLSGEALGNILRERYHLEMEMCAPEYVIGMTSVMDTEEGLLRLEKALWELDQELDTEPESVSGRTGEGHGDRGLSELPQPPLRLSPAEAMEMPGIRKRLSESAGSVSREFIYLYPPGIPVLAPGEEITEDVLERAAWYEAMGLSVQGQEDPSLSNIITVAEK